jgi:hypothetical protein
MYIFEKWIQGVRSDLCNFRTDWDKAASIVSNLLVRMSFGMNVDIRIRGITANGRASSRFRRNLA